MNVTDTTVNEQCTEVCIGADNTIVVYLIGLMLGVVLVVASGLLYKVFRYIVWILLCLGRFRVLNMPYQNLTESLYSSVDGLRKTLGEFLFVEDCILHFNPSNDPSKQLRDREKVDSYPMICKRVRSEGFLMMQLRGSIILFMDSKFYGHRNMDALDELASYFSKVLQNSVQGYYSRFIESFSFLKRWFQNYPWLLSAHQWVSSALRYKHRNLFVIDVDKTSYEQGRISFYKRLFDGSGKLQEIKKLFMPKEQKIEVGGRLRFDIDYMIIYSGNECYYFEDGNKLEFDISTKPDGYCFATCLLESGITNKRVFFTIQLYFGREDATKIMRNGTMGLDQFRGYLCFLFKKFQMSFYLFQLGVDGKTVEYGELIGENGDARQLKLTNSHQGIDECYHVTYCPEVDVGYKLCTIKSLDGSRYLSTWGHQPDMVCNSSQQSLVSQQRLP